LSNAKEVSKFEKHRDEVQQTSIIKAEERKVEPVENVTATSQALAVKHKGKQLKQRVTVHVPIHLIERVKNAVYYEPGLTVAGFCEQALSKAIDKLEKEKGRPYPSRREQLRGGRPIK